MSFRSPRLVGPGWALLTGGLLLCFLGAAGVYGFAAQPQNAGRHPNVIVVLVDDLGYGDFSCYGDTRIKTTNLDRLAAKASGSPNFMSTRPSARLPARRCSPGSSPRAGA